MRESLVGILRGIGVACLLIGQAQAQIMGSPHDLSASGASAVKAFGEDEVCFFCHTPHNAAPATPRWNQSLSTLVFTPYESSTLQALPGQPTGDSKLCLSCHDGTIGLGAELSPQLPISMSGVLGDRANLSSDLSDDHPVSFFYDQSLAAADAELVTPAALPERVRLDPNGQMQCTTCHDPHASYYGKFLVMDNQYSQLCVTCHDKRGWVGSAHEASAATWNGGGLDPWPHTDWANVASNGCENCHTPHAAGSRERLLNSFIEEDNCLSCHDGSVAAVDIEAEMRKLYTHPVDLSLGIHDPVEAPGVMARHVECEDCHDPHAATDWKASPPNISGPLMGAAGVTSQGTEIDEAIFEYEVCYRCHADSPNVPSPAIQRQIPDPNLRLKFRSVNPSFHPIEGPGRSSDVPSLIFPYTEASILYCTDCHSNDDGPGIGGMGPRGPHGSRWRFLLKREYRTADGTSESSGAYDLCYECHDRTSILNDESFEEHRKHVAQEDSPCSLCHDPHGISASLGNAKNHSHLINFDTSVVLPDPVTGRLEFEDLGSRRGRCYLECHGEAHSPEEY
jgi:predicted CXXCH cytochrome family protein